MAITVGGKKYMSSVFADIARGRPQTRRIIRMATPAAAPAAAAPAAAKQTLSPAARAAWEQAIAQYAPEGGYGKGLEAGIERGRTKAVAGGMQSLVSAGLAGTTEAGGLGKKYEEEVAMPARAQSEEVRAQAIANLKAGLAGAEQRGYETAEDRALRERLSESGLSTQTALANLQAGTQLSIAGTQAGTQRDIAGLQAGTQERISSSELAMRETLAKLNLQGQGEGGYGATQHTGTYPSPFA